MEKSSVNIVWKWVASRLGWLVSAASLVPLALLLVKFFTGHLTANPIQAATQQTGIAALVLLVLTLACTPLKIVFGSNVIARYRRTLGLFSFFYAVLHLLIFTGLDYGFSWGLIRQTLVEKPFIWFGAAALVVLSLLALTSHKWWNKKLGRNWKRLHRWIYLAAYLVIIHYLLSKKGDIFQFKGDIYQPLFFMAAVSILLIFRLPNVRAWIIRMRTSIHPPVNK